MRLRNRKVTLLRTGGDLIYISAGLDDGDLVSLTTLDSSFDSSEVHIHLRTPSNMLDQNGRPKSNSVENIPEATASVESGMQKSDG
jgi:hypothetical protein